MFETVICLYLSLFVFICLYLSLFLFICLLFVFICLYLSLFVFICLYLSLFVFICFYLSLFVFICLYLFLFVFICLYLSLFVFNLSLFVKICRSCRTSPVDLIPVVLVRCKRPMIFRYFRAQAYGYIDPLGILFGYCSSAAARLASPTGS